MFTDEQIHDAAIQNPEFMRQWMAYLARRANLHTAAYLDLLEILSNNIAFLDSETKAKVANIGQGVATANSFFEQIRDDALIRFGVLPDADDLLRELNV